MAPPGGVAELVEERSDSILDPVADLTDGLEVATVRVLERPVANVDGCVHAAEIERRTAHRCDGVTRAEFVGRDLPRCSVGEIDTDVVHDGDHFFVNTVGGTGAAGQDFDAVREAAAVALAFGERGGHLGAAGVLDAHEGDTNRVVGSICGHDRGISWELVVGR